jgi:hypothetical protein
MHACYMPNPSHAPWLDRLNNIWRTVKSWNYEVPHYAFSPVSCYTLPLRPKYIPQHPILDHSQPTSCVSQPYVPQFLYYCHRSCKFAIQ